MSNDNVRIHTVTFNYADQREVPADLKAFCGVEDEQNIPDLIVIGLQEIVDERTWKDALELTLSPFDFVLIKSRRMLSIMALAYLHRSMLKSVSRIESEIKPTGFADLVGNKGGISLRFRLFDISMCFVIAHFTAYDEQVEARVNDFNEVVSSHRFRDVDTPFILDHDYVFWLGDLNFRIDALAREEVEQAIERSDFDLLLRNDQLCKLVAAGDIFERFREGSINFQPTYKYDLGTDTYDTSSKRRKPAYCDRVLYLSHTLSVHNGTSLELALVDYSALDRYKQSDHRPVFADFDARVPSKFSNAMQCSFSLISDQQVSGLKKREAPRANDQISADTVRCFEIGHDLDFTFEFTCGRENASASFSWLTEAASSSLRSLLSLGGSLAGTKVTTPDKANSPQKAKKSVPSKTGETSISESESAALSTDATDCGNSACQSTVHQGNLFGYRGDWIGVYPVNFTDFEKYANFIYASAATPLDTAGASGAASRFSARLSSSLLQQLERSKHYLLAYFSSKQRGVIGYSEPFELI